MLYCPLEVETHHCAPQPAPQSTSICWTLMTMTPPSSTCHSSPRCQRVFLSTRLSSGLVWVSYYVCSTWQKKNHTHNMFHASICIFLCLLTKRTQNNRACCQVCTTFKVQPEIVDCYQALRVLAIQVQVQDPDEAENGAVTLVVQMGFPRLDFRLNSSTGVLFSTAVLDRERIAQYQLRLVAFDAGQFPRTSTSTLTITGTIQSGWHGWRGHFQLQHCSLV